MSGIFIFCLFLIPISSATENVSGTVLFTLTGEPSFLMLDGDRLFWLQQRESPDDLEEGLYVYNLTKGTRRELVRVSEPSKQNPDGTIVTVHEIATPVVSGDRVVFAETGIMLTDVSTGSTMQLTNQNDGSLPVSGIMHNQNPWIDGDRIVWTECSGQYYSSVSGGRIVLLNLTTEERYYVPAGMPGNQSYPRISGDYLIWRDYRDGKDYPDLYLMDIQNGTEMRLASSVTGIPFIQGDGVFWEEKNSQGIDTIIRYTISTGERSDLGSGWMGQTQAIPPVSDDRIVWRVSRSPTNIREEQGAVMVMDLRTGEKRQITSFGKGVSFPVISGNRIVYTRGAGDDWSREPREVVLYTLATQRPTVTISPSGSGTGDGSTRPSLVPSTPMSPGTTTTASAGLPGVVPITGAIACGIFWRITRRD